MTPEYRHLLLAERVNAGMLEEDGLKAAECAQVTRALVDCIRLKRDMRGCPDPRPVDVSKPTRKRKVQSGPDVWTDPTAPKV